MVQRVEIVITVNAPTKAEALLLIQEAYNKLVINDKADCVSLSIDGGIVYLVNVYTIQEKGDQNDKP